MKTIHLVFLLIVFLVQPTIGQELTGSWKAELEVMGQKIPLLFHFEKEDGQWTGKMDSPSQGAMGIPMSKVLFDGLMLAFEIGGGVISYEGLFVEAKIQGTFKQSGLSLPLDLLKADDNARENAVQRPQEPQAPFEYEIIETHFVNSLGNRLYGTITKPQGAGPFPAVILVTGSGPQNRNSEIFGHAPFWVMADYLTSHGIVVFRYDERGVGESEGNFSQATTSDFAKDAKAAFAHLTSFDYVDKSNAGMIGHSEGGLIAWVMAANTENTDLKFVLALAGPVVPIPDLMKKQTEDVSRSVGNPKALVEQQVKINSRFYQMVEESKNLEEAKSQVKALVNEVVGTYDMSAELKQEQINNLIPALERSLNPWFYHFIRTNPEALIEQIQIPVFAAFGGKDVQVNAAQNGNRLVQLFQGKDDLLTLKVYPNLNHLFQSAQTGAVSEYAEIEETFNEEVLKDIAKFILELN